ncbi:cystatin-A5-like [Notamacropus eugenii]|uniref:cystatin-A5-like n=1 Tax=Notamacropus eugenii TaxID=9315 RepID=UPI003B67F7B8
MATTMTLGGFGETKLATPEIQKIVDEVKSQFEQMTNEKYDCFRAENYRGQVVQGMNYLVKVHLGNDCYAHLMIFVPLPVTKEPLKVTDYQIGKTKDDELIVF